MTDLDQLERIVAEGRRLTVLAEELRLDAIVAATTDGEDPATILARFERALKPITDAMASLGEQQQKIAARLRGDA